MSHILLMLSLLPGTVYAGTEKTDRSEHPNAMRTMPAEFERQAAILLAWDGSDYVTRSVQSEIAARAHKSVPLLILARHQADHTDVIESLLRANVDLHRIRVIRTSIDSPWVRDFGPTVIRTGISRRIFIDARYDNLRPNDDGSPSIIAQRCGCETEQTGLVIEGGNLLSNGSGLVVATTRLKEKCIEAGYTHVEVTDRLREVYGAEQLVFLEPLEDECTGHVDMFMTFTAANTVVVGAYNADHDPVNAQVLDRNAERLTGLETSAGPLRVVRIPMPTRAGNEFPSWTNVVFANGTLLVPHYTTASADQTRQAFQTFRELLPGWQIQAVDCSSIISSGGALHCLTMNLPTLPRLPDSDSEDLPDVSSNPLIDNAIGTSDTLINVARPWPSSERSIQEEPISEDRIRTIVPETYPFSFSHRSPPDEIRLNINVP